jgi:multiple sugar transport system permease protein
MILSVAGALLAGLALALLLNRSFRGQKLVQTILLVPLMVAPVGPLRMTPYCGRRAGR